MKLLIVSPQPEHPPMDAFRVFRALGEELSRRGHMVDYFVEPGPPATTQDRISPGSPTLGTVGRGLRIAAHLNIICKRRGYDFLLTASSLGWCLSTFRQWLLSPHTQVLSWHGGAGALQSTQPSPDRPENQHASNAIPSQPVTWRERLTHWAGKKALETQDGYFFSATEAPVQVLAEHPQAEQRKILYLPNGVANYYYFPQRHQGQEGLLQPSRLLMSGQWTPGHHALAETFSRLHQHHPALRLSIINPGLNPAEILENFPAETRPAIHILPHVLNEGELIAAYQQHDIYLQASPNEGGVPLSLLEAMAAAMPVIADDAPGVRDVLKHYENGLLIPPRDGNALEQSITHLLENPELYRNLGESAYDYVSRYYTWRQVSDIFEAKLIQLQQAQPFPASAPDDSPPVHPG